MAKTHRIYWDACAWIAYIQKEMPGRGSSVTEKRYDMCRQTLVRATAGEFEIVTSSATLAEVCKAGKPGSPVQNLSAFFNHPYILLVDVDKRVGGRAQQLQLVGFGAGTVIKPFDAIHIASAQIANVDFFHTFDDKLLKNSESLNCDDGRPLKIVKPTEEIPPPPLFAHKEPGDG
jgi:predicted nucleic acid-binding protein